MRERGRVGRTAMGKRSGVWGRHYGRIVKLGIGLSLGLFGLTAYAQQVQSPMPAITITVNQSRILSLERRTKRIAVTQPEIAEVVVLTPKQVLINGKTVGKTSLIVWDERETAAQFELIITPDTDGLSKRLETLFPGNNIDVSSSGPAIVLRGEVANEVVYDKVLDVARTYLPPPQAEDVAPSVTSQSVTVTTRSTNRLPRTGTAFAGGGQLAFLEEAALTDTDRWNDKRKIPGLIDLLVIKEIRQIEISVIVAEVSLSKAREIGFDLLGFGKHLGLLSLAGSQGGFTGGNLLADPSGFPPTAVFGQSATGVVTYLSDSVQIAALYRLFRNKEIATILAQPKLVIKNGRVGGFLAGGELPIPIATDDNIDIQFKPFGVRLDILPTLTWSNRIDLRIFPEVSEIDPSVSITFGGVSIPGFRVRRSVSRVEMKEGETLVLSGLIDKRTLKSVTKVPFLGDLPVLGTFFRSTSFRDQETELIFVITPRIARTLDPGVKPVLPTVQKYQDADMSPIPPAVPTESSSESSSATGSFEASPDASAPAAGATIP